MSKEGTIHLTYWREYYDSEEYGYDAWFKIHHTILRNVPLSQLKRLNSETFKNKIKKYCDKHFNETASNATGNSGVDMIVGDEYYNTYYDEFGESTGVGLDNALFNDYGQLYNTRQFFKYDFDPKFTKRFINKTYGRTN